MVQLSQPNSTIGKATALTMQTFVGRVMSLLFNTLSRFVITFLPRSNCLLISSLLSLSAVILEPKMRESVAQFSPVAQLCLTLCDPMDCSMPGFPVPHHLLEFVHVHPLNQWCHSTISFSEPLFSLSPQSFPTSETFPMSQLFASNDKNARASASASVLPVNIHSQSPLKWTGLISLLSKGLSGVFFSTTVWRHQFLWCSAFFTVQLSQPYVTTGRTIALTMLTFVSRVMSLLCNTLSRLLTAFLARSNCLLISWLQSPSTKET